MEDHAVEVGVWGSEVGEGKEGTWEAHSKPAELGSQFQKNLV